jgi:hypothetical protein
MMEAHNKKGKFYFVNEFSLHLFQVGWKQDRLADLWSSMQARQRTPVVLLYRSKGTSKESPSDAILFSIVVS